MRQGQYCFQGRLLCIVIEPADLALTAATINSLIARKPQVIEAA